MNCSSMRSSKYNRCIIDTIVPQLLVVSGPSSIITYSFKIDCAPKEIVSCCDLNEIVIVDGVSGLVDAIVNQLLIFMAVMWLDGSVGYDMRRCEM